MSNPTTELTPAPLSAEQLDRYHEKARIEFIGDGIARQWTLREVELLLATIEAHDAELAAERVKSAALYEAAKANLQCTVDLIEVYKRDGAKLVLDEAIKSLRDDGLRLTRLAMNKYEGGAK